MSIEAMKQALEALKRLVHLAEHEGWEGFDKDKQAITALRTAISQAESREVEAAEKQEPVALEEYDAGILSRAGGGDVSWWQDYIRSELGSAYEYYQSQITTPPAAQQWNPEDHYADGWRDAMESVKRAAAPVQEPVAWLHPDWPTYRGATSPVVTYPTNGWKPLYTAPPAAKRQWVDLRDTDVARLICLAGFSPDWPEYKIAESIVVNVINLFKERNT